MRFEHQRRLPGGVVRLAVRLVLVSPLVGISAWGASPVAGQTPRAPLDRDDIEQTGYRGTAGDRTVFVPAVDAAPNLGDFRDMHPPLETRRQYAVVDGFTQRSPSDGEPASHRTQVLIGYDQDALHLVFLAWDAEPDAVRARLARREDIGADDHVWVTLDPFRDRQRGYEFAVNPLGVQRDALWTEGAENGADFSFDTLWDSEGMRTDQGYVVRLSIPFASLRFPREDIQTWGIVLGRWSPRGAAEESYWPAVSSRVEGVLNQAGAITGLQDISPGRNIRLIPYGTFRSFRVLDSALPGGPGFVRDPADPAGGLDAKVVVKDALVFDATFNPDFSQVESDRPQNTVNERFEVFFPEKRPFFLENANYFRTPINLLFTRRIADPQMGLRATGKMGRWAVGALAIDDRAPGARLDPNHDSHGDRAAIGVLRVARDLGAQNRLGAIWIDRTFGGEHDRVAGVDGRFKLDDNWVVEGQAVSTETTDRAGVTRSGPGYVLEVARSGRSFDSRTRYIDLDEQFTAAIGFVPRVGIKRLTQEIHWRIWSEGEIVQRWGPNVRFEAVWDREGAPLDVSYNPWLAFQLAGSTRAGLFVWGQQTRLRPVDFPGLSSERTYDHRVAGFFLESQLLSWMQLDTWHNRGTRLNFVPAAGSLPEVGPASEGRVRVDIRPGDRVRTAMTWLYSTLDAPGGAARAFRSDIFRLRLDYQLDRRLSFRVIGQFERLDTDPLLTRLERGRSLNLDLLATYLVNPWTSLFVGYNRNARDLELLAHEGVRVLRRTDGSLHGDAHQLFVKVSYLFAY